MITESQYLIPCLCGRIVESHERASRCPSCGRLLIVATVEEAAEAEQRECEEQKAGQR